MTERTKHVNPFDLNLTLSAGVFLAVCVRVALLAAGIWWIPAPWGERVVAAGLLEWLAQWFVSREQDRQMVEMKGKAARIMVEAMWPRKCARDDCGRVIPIGEGYHLLGSGAAWCERCSARAG